MGDATGGGADDACADGPPWLAPSGGGDGGARLGWLGSELVTWAHSRLTGRDPHYLGSETPIRMPNATTGPGGWRTPGWFVVGIGVDVALVAHPAARAAERQLVGERT